VEVLRDTWGVPHIHAKSTEDLFFAQGFVVAQDRMWQLEIWRRNAEGRLAEVLGRNTSRVTSSEKPTAY
jgi:penicillin amidase